MRVTASLRMLVWFRRFWRAIERGVAEEKLPCDPLLRVRENWEWWWDTRLAHSQRARINQLVADLAADREAQAHGLDLIQSWLLDRFDRRCEVPSLVLMQMADLPLFQWWRGLDAARLENQRGWNGIIVPSGVFGNAAEIRPLIVWPLPRPLAGFPGAALPDFRRYGVPIPDAAIASARDATMRLLKGIGPLILIGLWGWGTWKRRSLSAHALLLGSGILATGLLAYLRFGPDLPEATLKWLMGVLSALVGGLVISASFWITRQLRFARQLARLLESSQLCVAIGGPRDGMPHHVEGSSFGMALSVSILHACLKDALVRIDGTPFWRDLLQRLEANQHRFSLTGTVSDSGRIGPVSRLEEKTRASHLHPQITHMAVPLQKAERTPLSAVRSRGSPGAHSAATAPGGELRRHRFFHLAQIVLTVSGLWNRRVATVNGVGIAVVALTIFAAAMGQIGEILSPPPPPEDAVLSWVRSVGRSPARPEEHLFLRYTSGRPGRESVRLMSRYWAYRHESFPVGGPSVTKFAMLPLIRLPRAEESGPVREVVIARERTFLWRKLPDRVLRRLPVPDTD